MNFVLLSWLNAFYSFDYQWSLRGRRLEERIQFFEKNWAYFAGSRLSPTPFSLSLWNPTIP